MDNEKISKKQLQEIKKHDQELVEFYTNQFTKQLRKVMVEKFKGIDKNKFYNKIYTDLNISRTAFYNYTKSSLPKNTETILKIKDYFDVPFSYLFGETSSLQSDKINTNAKYGLTDNSLETLEKLVKEAKSKNEQKANIAKEKLATINSLITNDVLITILAVTFKSLANKPTSENAKNGKSLYFLDKDIANSVKYYKPKNKQLNMPKKKVNIN